jgi:preprotein translocase SecE subunit
MAVAVNDQRETASEGLLDRLPWVSLFGVIYVVASLAILFTVLPLAWVSLWGALGFNTSSFASYTLQGMLMLAGAVGLVVVGGLLLGPRPVPGVKAGIFTALIGLLVVIGLTRWVSVWVEHFAFDYGLFSRTVGAVIVGVVGLVLLFLGARMFFSPRFERFLLAFEEQGWFSSNSYKKNQGTRVRRGTIVGILILLWSGIWTMWSHKTLERGPESWEVNVPFTGKVTLTRDDLGDTRPELEKLYPGWFQEGAPPTLTVDAYVLRDVNAHYDASQYVKITHVPTGVPGFTSEFEPGQIVSRSAYEKEKKAYFEKAEITDPKDQERQSYAVAPTPALGSNPADSLTPGAARTGPEVYNPAVGWIHFTSLTLLPHVRYTLPLLLLALSIWFAWRLVSLPVFADFLIATEAELNKVSWTTRKRLFQDTIVVLVTVILMVVYLFAMDAMWGAILSWKPIGVIVTKESGEALKPEQKPW